MTAENINKFEQLISKFCTLPKLPNGNPLTFLGVSGYPRYENVCSNILAFFFNREQSHGMEDLFIKSLLEAVGKHDYDTSGITTVVSREFSTDMGRIDILIETEQFDIIIENKIGAPLYNELGSYYSFIKKRQGKQQKGIIPIVLSLWSVDQNEKKKLGRFENLLYGNFLKSIENNLGNYICGAHAEWLVFLKNFIQEINNQGGENKMKEATFSKSIRFFREYEKEISELKNEQIKIIEFFKKQVETVAERLNSYYAEKGHEFAAWASDVEPNRPRILASAHRLVKSGSGEKYYERFEVVRCLHGWAIQLNAGMSEIEVVGKQKKTEQRILEITRLLEADGFEPEPDIIGNISGRKHYIPIWTHENSDDESITEEDVVEKAIELLERLFANHT